jgi:6-phosphofructo-2-kinase
MAVTTATGTPLATAIATPRASSPPTTPMTLPIPIPIQIQTPLESSPAFVDPFQLNDTSTATATATPTPASKRPSSECALCTDDEDSYIDNDRYSLASSYHASSSLKRDQLDANEFHARPLTDTPVFSALDLDDDDDIDIDIKDDTNGIGNGYNNGINLLDLNLNIPNDNDQNTPGNTASDVVVSPPRDKDKEKIKIKIKEPHLSHLVSNPMERIESQETAVITRQTDSSTNLSSFGLGLVQVSDFPISDKLVVVMIGLPARGKSYLSNKMVRYLNWLQLNSKIFNVGATRRMKCKNGGQNVGPYQEPLPDQDASFFSADNKESVQLREQWARETLDCLLDSLIDGDGCVGVFDATNTTVARRKMVFDRVKQRSGGKIKVLFLESICNDHQLIEKNILLKLKGPDYKDMPPTLAKEDFEKRLANYEKVYETISPEEEANPDFQYIKMIDVGRKVISCNIDGFIASQIVYYFLNFNLNDRLIFVTRHGESTDNTKGRIGGDAPLTERGRKYAIALERFVSEKKHEFDLKHGKDEQQRKVAVITSALKRAIETAAPFNDAGSDIYECKQLRLLNELGSGNFDGMTYAEIARLHPAEFEDRIEHKLTYRYPGIGGESYLDVIGRLKPVINEIERSKSHLAIISHRVVCRIIMAYFLNLEKDSIGDLDVPLHCVYTFEPKPFGVLWHLYEYQESIDTFKEVDMKQRTSNNKAVKTVQQVGIAYRERKYSVVPTAPNESGLSRKSSFQSRNRSSSSTVNVNASTPATASATSAPLDLTSIRSSLHDYGRMSQRLPKNGRYAQRKQ